MNTTVNRRWTGLDGQLVIDFTVVLQPDELRQSMAEVTCTANPGVDHSLPVRPDRRSCFNFNFPSGCHMRGWMEQVTPVHYDGQTCTAIMANLTYGNSQSGEQHFEGTLLACPLPGPMPPGPTPKPPEPPEPVPNPSVALTPMDQSWVVTDASQILFPYIHVMTWPEPKPLDLALEFFGYTPCQPPSGSYYDTLAQLPLQTRSALVALSWDFINGVAPYTGNFVDSVATLVEPVNQFAMLYPAVTLNTDSRLTWQTKTVAELQALLTCFGLDSGYFQSGAYQTTIDSVWQSYIALVVVQDYRAALSGALSQTLLMAHIVQVLDSAGKAPVPAELSPTQIKAVCEASILLPTPVFPLPAATVPVSATVASNAVSTADTVKGDWVDLYAIGDLQMVRQRLLRYQPGELARVENFMPGECRETATRQLEQHVDAKQDDSHKLFGDQTGNANNWGQFQDESTQTLAESVLTDSYDNFASTYGPPTQFTLNGKFSRQMVQGAQPGGADQTSFARQVLQQTVHRVNRQVSQARLQHHSVQTEQSSKSTVDNRASPMARRVAFHWLDKVMRACVVNYGRRLLLEFMVNQPAQAVLPHAGPTLVNAKAQRLRLHGINGFEDIQPTNWLTLAASVGLGDLEPPPAPRLLSTCLMGSGVSRLALTAGYYASAIQASACLPTGLGLSASLLVGSQLFQFTASTTTVSAQMDATTPAQNLHEPDIPLALAVTPAPTTVPPQASPTWPDLTVLVTVTITCTPTPTLLDEWRLRCFMALEHAWEERWQDEQRRRQAEVHQIMQLPPSCRRNIQAEVLKQACIALLIQRQRHLTHSQASPPVPSVGVNTPAFYEPRLVQFLDAALEWQETSCRFYPPNDALGNVSSEHLHSDPNFAAFLRAKHARIIVPVEPRLLMAFLYFYASGTLWSGADPWVPVNPGDVPLVNDLKHSGMNPDSPPKPVGLEWEVVMPTTFQTIEEALGKDHAPEPSLDAGTTEKKP